MADSVLTKRALANSLMELMNEKPFEKISVTDICERCGMNRKSFYYHFQDKYELVNWIFDQQFLKLLETDIDDRVQLLQKAFDTFYEYHDFYRHAFKIEGQNSFNEHFREIITPVIKDTYMTLIHDSNAYNRQLDKYMDFYIDIHSDAIISAIKRWLSVKNCMSSKEFGELMHLMVTTTIKICESDVLDI